MHAYDLRTEAGQIRHYAAIKARLYGQPKRQVPEVKAAVKEAVVQPMRLPLAPPTREKRARAKRQKVSNVVEFLRDPNSHISEISSVPAWKGSRVNFNQHVIDYRRYLVNMEEQDYRPTMEEITRGVIERFPHLTLADLKGSSKCSDVVMARQIAQYRIKQVYGEDLSYPAIGRFFGGRDHTTVLHAVRKISRLVAAAE